MNYKIQKAVRGLNHSSREKREKSISNLVCFGDASLNFLLKALSGSDYIQGANAATALGKIGNPIAVEYLIKRMCRNECVMDHLVQKNAAAALGMIRDTRAVYPLIALFAHEDSEVRESALNALVLLGNDSIDALINSLQHQTTYVRSFSAMALGRIKHPRSVPALITALEDKLRYDYFIVRKNAARALGEIGSADALKPLISALNDAYEYVREAAAYALYAITGESFGSDCEAWKKWSEQVLS
ncbi:MAG: HEAT repeat domain-containing protein [bacterium]|nr:HEAT repeat domain-containing protein [bacterium]